MRLSVDEIKNVTVGALSCDEGADGIRFYKVTKEEREIWCAKSDWFAKIAGTCTGIKLDFITDGTAVKFVFDGEGVYDLFINGLLRKHYKTSGEIEIEEELTDAFGRPYDSDVRVTVYLPSHTFCTVKAVGIKDATKAELPKFDKKFLFLGDSITQGWNSGYDSMSYANRLSQFFNAYSVIQGMGGGRFFPDTLLPIPFDPDVVFVAYGTNDFVCCKTLAEFDKNAKDYLAKVKKMYGNKKVIVITPTYRNETVKDIALVDVREKIRAAAIKNKFFIVDGLTLLPPVADMYAEDVCLHPNANGFSIYAENLIKQIQDFIK